MSEIQRYYLDTDGLYESHDGAYVNYNDHARELAAKEARIVELTEERDAALKRVEEVENDPDNISWAKCDEGGVPYTYTIERLTADRDRWRTWAGEAKKAIEKARGRLLVIGEKGSGTDDLLMISIATYPKEG